MRLQIEVVDNIIVDAKFKTFGCGSAIASSSVATEWLKGKSLDEAMTIDNMDLVEELNLPPVKIHCSVLAEDAIKSAINDYRVKNGLEPIVFEESHIQSTQLLPIIKLIIYFLLFIYAILQIRLALNHSLLYNR